jgi:hypothetical protein
MKSFAVAVSVTVALSFLAIPALHAEEWTMNKLHFPGC